MENIDEQLNNISLVEVPIGVHHFVMQRVNYKKFQPLLFFVFFLLVFNFIVVAWQIDSKLIDVEFADMIQDFFEVFNFDFSFLSTIWTSFFEIIPPVLVFSAFLSLMGIIYTGKKISSYRLVGF